MIPLDIVEGIACESLKVLPEEACGFVVDNEIVPCKNVHSLPLTNFAIAAEDYARAESLGDIQFVYHSHVDAPCRFSLHDIKACKQSNLPWLIYHPLSGDHTYADPRGSAPYEGRCWVYGIHDCYGLVRDFFLNEFGITLDDFERGDEEEWKASEWNMFEKHWQMQGFYEIEAPQQKGDVVLMQIESPTPNHVGVIAGKGNKFYHHLLGRYSEASTWGDFWSKMTVKTLRHKEAR
jgi:proteasome lid subunit RPN8/RPN11